MDYKELTSKCYKIYKHENIWNAKDMRVLENSEKFLQHVVEEQLKSVGFLPADKQSINNIPEPVILNLRDSNGYDKFALELYKTFKHFSQWNNQDKKRVLIVENVLQTEIESELKKAGFVIESVKTAPVAPESELNKLHGKQIIEDINEHIKPLSLMERVFAEQDITPVVDMSPKKSVSERYSKEALGIVEEPVKSDLPDKRYYVTIMCSSITSKPSYQIFKGLNIIAKNFKTDEIITAQCTYYAVVDSNKADISLDVAKHFSNAYVSDFAEHEANWIPVQYSTIFRNETKIK